jgi:hypothetical protein
MYVRVLAWSWVLILWSAKSALQTIAIFAQVVAHSPPNLLHPHQLYYGWGWGHLRMMFDWLSTSREVELSLFSWRERRTSSLQHADRSEFDLWRRSRSRSCLEVVRSGTHPLRATLPSREREEKRCRISDFCRNENFLCILPPPRFWSCR